MSAWGVATCKADGEPLVATMAFHKAEFYCLACGRTFGFLGPAPAPETPEMLERVKAAERLWGELGGNEIITPFAYRRDCPKCQIASRESHDLHATQAEQARHELALHRLAEHAHRKAVPA